MRPSGPPCSPALSALPFSHRAPNPRFPALVCRHTMSPRPQRHANAPHHEHGWVIPVLPCPPCSSSARSTCPPDPNLLLLLPHSPLFHAPSLCPALHVPKATQMRDVMSATGSSLSPLHSPCSLIPVGPPLLHPVAPPSHLPLLPLIPMRPLPLLVPPAPLACCLLAAPPAPMFVCPLALPPCYQHDANV